MIVPLDKGKCECGWALVRRGTNKTGTNQLTGLWWAGGITPFDHIAHQLANSFVPAISQSSFQSNCDILLLVFMTILAQSFFTLVRSHLVAFTFLSVWHSRKMFYYNIY